MNINLKALQERIENLEKMINQMSSEFYEGMKNSRAIMESCVAKRLRQINENHRKIGSVSKVFTEAKIKDFEYFYENALSSAIRETTYGDVTSEYFISWFFEDDDWVE